MGHVEVMWTETPQLPFHIDGLYGRPIVLNCENEMQNCIIEVTGDGTLHMLIDSSKDLLFVVWGDYIVYFKRCTVLYIIRQNPNTFEAIRTVRYNNSDLINIVHMFGKSILNMEQDFLIRVVNDSKVVDFDYASGVKTQSHKCYISIWNKWCNHEDVQRQMLEYKFDKYGYVLNKIDDLRMALDILFVDESCKRLGIEAFVAGNEETIYILCGKCLIEMKQVENIDYSKVFPSFAKDIMGTNRYLLNGLYMCEEGLIAQYNINSERFKGLKKATIEGILKRCIKIDRSGGNQCQQKQ